MTGNIRTTYAYGVGVELLSETTGATTKDYVWIGGRLVGEKRVNGAEVARTWFLTDQVGSVIAALDWLGRVKYRNEYDAFGGSNAYGFEADTARFTGKQYDEGAGLYYFNARWYDHGTGRFTTEDPARDGDNWYAYCGNEPMLRTDPTGLLTIGQLKKTRSAKAASWLSSELYGMDDNGSSNDKLRRDEEKKHPEKKGKKHVVIALFPGGGDYNSGTTWLGAANTKAEEIMSSLDFDPRYDIVIVKQIDSVKELADLLREGGIDTLSIFGHGGPDWWVVGSGEGDNKREYLTVSDLTKLFQGAFNEGGRIYLYTCLSASTVMPGLKSASPPVRNIAQAMAIYFNVTVQGFASGARASTSPDELIWNGNIPSGGAVWILPLGLTRLYGPDGGLIIEW